MHTGTKRTSMSSVPASIPADEFNSISEDIGEGHVPRIIKAHIDLTGMKDVPAPCVHLDEAAGKQAKEIADKLIRDIDETIENTFNPDSAFRNRKRNSRIFFEKIAERST